MVRQLDVYDHPQQSMRARFPYLIVLQHDSVPPRLGEVLAAPLAPRGHSDADRLQPILVVGGHEFQLLTPYMDRIPVRRLRNPVTNLSDINPRIIKAIDMLFVGS